LEKTFNKIKDAEEKASQLIVVTKQEIDDQKEALEIELEQRRKDLLKREKAIIDKALSDSEVQAQKNIEAINMETKNELRKIEDSFVSKLEKATGEILKEFGKWQ